jgi:hypothetical protein
MTMAYTDQEIRDLDEFARAVIEAVSAEDPRQLYAAQSTEAYQQYFAEVYCNLSGMRDNPRNFFESDLSMRKAWGERIAAYKARYEAAMQEAARQEKTEPDNVKALREQLERVVAELETLKVSLNKPSEPVTTEETPDTEA